MYMNSDYLLGRDVALRDFYQSHKDQRAARLWYTPRGGSRVRYMWTGSGTSRHCWHPVCVFIL